MSVGAFLCVNIGFGLETKDKRTELLCLPGCPVTGSRPEAAFPSDCRFCCQAFTQWCFSCESAVLLSEWTVESSVWLMVRFVLVDEGRKRDKSVKEVSFCFKWIFLKRRKSIICQLSNIKM